MRRHAARVPDLRRGERCKGGSRSKRRLLERHRENRLQWERAGKRRSEERGRKVLEANPSTHTRGERTLSGARTSPTFLFFSLGSSLRADWSNSSLVITLPRECKDCIVGGKDKTRTPDRQSRVRSRNQTICFFFHQLDSTLLTTPSSDPLLSRTSYSLELSTVAPGSSAF